ncbi:MAG: FtsX-like permease family protein, partial [Rikenellaceae bacterium]
MKNLKSFFIFLSRNKLYTFINVFGLSISLMFVILIANYTVGELTIDDFHTNRDRIYILGNGEHFGSAHNIVNRLEGRYPEIEKMCVVAKNDDIVWKILNKNYSVDPLFVDSTFLDMFSFDLVRGDRKEVLRSKNNVVLSETFANKVFGSQNPVGETINIFDSVSLVVSGVFKTPRNTMFALGDVWLPFDNIKYYNESMISDLLSNAAGANVFLQTFAGTDITQKENDMLGYFKTVFWVYERELWNKVKITPFHDIYFSDRSSDYLHSEAFNIGDYKRIMIFISVGILILLFAVTNYINLTVAQTSFRAKEMATRRLVGSSRRAVFSKMIIESFAMCLVAFVVGLLFAASLEPYVNNILGAKISIFGNMTYLWIAYYALFIIILSIIAGVIPAIAVSNFKPIDVVKGSFKYKSKMLYSKIFIIFQNVITIVLISSAITMVLQIRHLVNADMGYKHDAIIDLGLGSINYSKETYTSLRNELQKLPCVESVGFSCGTPLGGGNNITMNYKEDMISFQMLPIDSAGFKMLGFQKIRDNNLADKRKGVWFNETAMRVMGLPIDTTMVKIGENDIMIAGVVKDFQIRNIVDQIIPCYMTIREDVEPWEMLIKVNGDLVKAFDDVKGVYEPFSNGVEFTGRYVDDDIRNAYESQRKTSVIVVIFTIIAILISALGLLAMATYFIQQRSMEIAVRKVFGSTSGEV